MTETTIIYTPVSKESLYRGEPRTIIKCLLGVKSFNE